MVSLWFVSLIEIDAMGLPNRLVKANQPVHWFLEGKVMGLQQGPSAWVGSPKSSHLKTHKTFHPLVFEMLPCGIGSI